MEISIDMRKESGRIGTCGGEMGGTFAFDDYGIQIGELFISGLESKDMKTLAIAVVNHLYLNGHRFEFRKTGESDLREELVSTN